MEVAGSILGQVHFLFADSHLLQFQHLLAAVHAAVISCCESSSAYDFFSYGQSTFMQCYSVALHKHEISAPVHAG